MSRLINSGWDCPACLAKNQLKIVKPKPTEFTLCKKFCPDCGSYFVLEFRKIPNKHEVTWQVLEYKFTEKGKDIFDLRTKKQNPDAKAQTTKETTT